MTISAGHFWHKSVCRRCDWRITAWLTSHLHRLPFSCGIPFTVLVADTQPTSFCLSMFGMLCEAESPFHCYSMLLIRLFFLTVKQNKLLIISDHWFYAWASITHDSLANTWTFMMASPPFPFPKSWLFSTLKTPKLYNGYLEFIFLLKLVPLIWIFYL